MVDSLLGGGAERVAVEAAVALNRDRYVPHLLVTRDGGPLEERLVGGSVEYTVLGRRRGFSPRKFARARRVVRGGVLLHAHKFEGAMWGALLAGASRRPLVAHEHTYSGLQVLLREVGYRALIAPSASRIVCVSSGVAASLQEHGVPPEKLAIVPNGVPVEDVLDRNVARHELGLASDELVVGLVARLRPEKRHELALRALALLRAEGVPVRMCLVGDGPQRSGLLRLSAGLGLGGSVVWAGDRPNARRLQAAFDAVLFCSAFEGMPLSALEALVAGVPIVSTAVGAMPELLAEGGGLIVDGTPDAIAAGLRRALEGGVSIESAMRERASEAHSIDRMARDLERVYDAALGRAA
jgi:glycosyltransferase involved in cell wall biosynthesis